MNFTPKPTGAPLLRKAFWIAGGGLGLHLAGSLWATYWRKREYLADAYAASLGQADELADFLEIHALIHDHPVPLIWLSEQTHPPTELRIDKLRAAGVEDSGPVARHEVAELSAPVKGAPAGPPSAGLRPPLTGTASPALERSGLQGGPCRPSIDER